MSYVVVVEDDVSMRKFVTVNLTSRGYTVCEASDGASAMTLIKRRTPDLVIVDLLMPRVDGIELCTWIRERSDVPIIVLSAQEQEYMKVQALDIGADDYITKPFGSEELLARIRAVMRRTNAAPPSDSPNGKIDIHGLEIDLNAKRVFVNGEGIRLTRTEFALLTELIQNRDTILTHDELLARVWGPEYRGSSHYVHIYLGRLRTKIGEKHSHILETIPGVGYILHSHKPA